MTFLIADTVTHSLAPLTGEEQKAVKTTAIDLQMNATAPGLSFHRLDRARDPNFWSVRVSANIRLIVRRTSDSLLLCYVNHHDKAYAWAARRKLQTHPSTGAAQLIEVRGTVVAIPARQYVAAADTPASAAADTPASAAVVHTAPALFPNVSDIEFLSYGVPDEWIPDARVATEDTLFILTEQLPKEAAEAFLELATGGTPVTRPAAAATTDPFTHPDAQRRFRILANADELKRALAYPREQWSVFLHPTQRDVVQRSFAGPARVAGSAGTGKTVVARHRAVHLARQHTSSRILLTTFSITLARTLRQKLQRLVGDDDARAHNASPSMRLMKLAFLCMKIRSAHRASRKKA